MQTEAPNLPKSGCSQTIFSLFCVDARLVPSVDLPLRAAISTLFWVSVLHNLRGPMDAGRNTDRALLCDPGARAQLHTLLGEHWRRRGLLELLRDAFDHRLVRRTGPGVRIQGEC